MKTPAPPPSEAGTSYAMPPIARACRLIRYGLPVVAVAALCVHVTPAMAEDPMAPARIIDDLNEWTLVLALDGLNVSDVTMTLSFNRFAGAVIDDHATKVQGIPVHEVLIPTFDGQQYIVDASPTVPGMPPLPDGLYSSWITLDIDPQGQGMSPWTALHPLYYEVVAGYPQRITMLEYSDQAVPTVLGMDKFGEKLDETEGLMGTGLPAIQQGDADRMIEMGARYNSDPPTEQNEL